MKYYIGIDLGTTNSAISSFDGERVRVWRNKSDQSDVTPSVIYADKKGKRFYGRNAYMKAMQQPERCAILFKRFMGTNTKIQVGNEKLLPEECSAEILRELYRNLPEEIRTCEETYTVITVPAAFNQMQNAATVEAAKMAGIGHVALMQEPVAAIMSIMKENNENGKFLIYDLGGGTLDIAIAENMNGKVNLLSHGGIAMCGGRDFDRAIMDTIVIPWLHENYILPDDLKTSNKYKKLLQRANYQSEIAKIDLSVDNSTNIDDETGIDDEDGNEIYLDIAITRDGFNQLIEPFIDESIKAAQETIIKAGLSAADIDRIIFIGGPTNYKPIRDKVTNALGIKGSMEVNPMTAVSEGASIFAESVDWSSNEHVRKSGRGKVESSENLGLELKYMARTTQAKAKIAVVLRKPVEGYHYEIVSLDTGWTSGVVELKHNSIIQVPLAKKGENQFRVNVYDTYERAVELSQETITISKTLASVEAILASHSIGVEVQDISDECVSLLDYLVHEGDTLPVSGEKIFRATQSVKAGSSDAINFKLWEGEITDSVKDNRFIGLMKISGTDFDYGMIAKGARIICKYTINDSGSINLEISVPAIAEIFNSDKNFYSRKEGQLDLDNAASIVNQEGENVLESIKRIGYQTNHKYDTHLNELAEIASEAIDVQQDTADREILQKLNNQLLQIKKELNRIRQENLDDIRRAELEGLKSFYANTTKKYAKGKDEEEYKKLFSHAEESLCRTDTLFERTLDEVRYLNFSVLFNNSIAFLLDYFKGQCRNKFNYIDEGRFDKLKDDGNDAMQKEDWDALRSVILDLDRLRIHTGSGNMLDAANITKG